MYLEEKNRDRLGIRPIHMDDLWKNYMAVVRSPWNWEEVRMANDIVDWNNLLPDDQRIFSRLLRGFTLGEIYIGCYWGNIGNSGIEDYEAVAMARAFSFQETIHGGGYDYLESSLGLNTALDTFIPGSKAKKKLDLLEEVLNDYSSDQSLALSLGIFSGGFEAVSLFGAFATLMSFCRKRIFKGVGQILSWSMIDESLHAKGGLALFHRFMDKLTPEERQATIERVHNWLLLITEYEVEFLEECFEGSDCSYITVDEAISFVWHRYGESCKALGMDDYWMPDDMVDITDLKEYLYTSVKGLRINDFFDNSRNGGGYSGKLSFNLGDADTEKIQDYLKEEFEEWISM